MCRGGEAGLAQECSSSGEKRRGEEQTNYKQTRAHDLAGENSLDRGSIEHAFFVDSALFFTLRSARGPPPRGPFFHDHEAQSSAEAVTAKPGTLCSAGSFLYLNY